MKRHIDWRRRLSDAIEAQRREPFSWGGRDCATFVADCIEAMTGVDLAASFRGRYADAAGAIRVLEAGGFSSLCDLAASYLEEIHPAFASMGDVMAFPAEPTGWSLGIVNGEMVTVLTPSGLGSISRETATRAFRVPG